MNCPFEVILHLTIFSCHRKYNQAWLLIGLQLEILFLCQCGNLWAHHAVSMQFNLFSFDREKVLHSKLGQKRFPILGTNLWCCTRIQVRIIKKSPGDTLMTRKQRYTTTVSLTKQLRKRNLSKTTSYHWRRKENSIDPTPPPYISHVGAQVGYWGIQKIGNRACQALLSYLLDVPLLNVRFCMADFGPYGRAVHRVSRKNGHRQAWVYKSVLTG